MAAKPSQETAKLVPELGLKTETAVEAYPQTTATGVLTEVDLTIFATCE